MARRYVPSLAPENLDVPERVTNVVEVKLARPNPARQGQRQAEEMIIFTDPAVISEAYCGVRDGELVGEGPNAQRPAAYHRQAASETERQRARSRSSTLFNPPSWTTQTDYLGAFAAGTSPEAERTYLHVQNSGQRYARHNEAEVQR